jgi:integrase
MSKSRKKKTKKVLALPDLEQAKPAVLSTLTSVSGQRTYDHAITDFVEWYCSEPRLAFNRTVVLRYRIYLEQKGYAPNAINLRLAAVRRVAYEACDSGLLSPELGAGIRRVKGVRRLGIRVGNWLTPAQGKLLLERSDTATLRGKRKPRHSGDANRVRSPTWRTSVFRYDSIQVREEHWVIADLRGKAGHIRTAPVPRWVKAAVDLWSTAAGITEGTVFRSINKSGSVWGDGMTPKVLWEVVKEAATRAGIEKLAPHDLRTCARLCHLASGELDQIQFVLAVLWTSGDDIGDRPANNAGASHGVHDARQRYGFLPMITRRAELSFSIYATRFIRKSLLPLTIWRVICIRIPTCGCPMDMCSRFQHMHHGGREGLGKTGGLVEIDDQGKVIRSSSAADLAFPGALLTPYRLIVLPELDRVVSTNSSMHQEDIFRGSTYQVWRLSDLKLLKTEYFDTGEDHYGQISPEEPRLGPDGAIYVQTLGCGIERITGVNTDKSKSQVVHLFPGSMCGVPTIVGHYLIQSVPVTDGLIVLDIAHGQAPVEVSRLKLGDDYIKPALDWMGRERAAPGGDRRIDPALSPETGSGDW